MTEHKSLYYYSMKCPRTRTNRNKGQACDHACNLDCHWLGVDEQRKYYCRWPGRGHIINGGRGE
jgi:hypothetical protein